jgi:hypothetical protein
MDLHSQGVFMMNEHPHTGSITLHNSMVVQAFRILKNHGIHHASAKDHGGLLMELSFMISGRIVPNRKTLLKIIQ